MCCLDEGRVRKSATWSWDSPDRRIVSIVLDGGRQEGGPSLGVVYRSAAALESKPN
jgi:hypothetical protein